MLCNCDCKTEKQATSSVVAQFLQKIEKVPKWFV